MPYVVISPITHLGKPYAVGDAIEPMPHEIGQLVASGCIKEVPPPVTAMDAPTGYVPPKVETSASAKGLPRSRVSLGD